MERNYYREDSKIAKKSFNRCMKSMKTYPTFTP